jgi:hypothetical protein
MPDISMCIESKCPLSKTCYRFLATPSTPQWYSMYTPGENCKSYIDINEKKKRSKSKSSS